MIAASRDADRIRTGFWGDDVPVDPVLIARSLGITVLNAQLDDNVSGALIKERHQDPQIVLNQSDNANRRRFTCAHEIGHYVKRSEELDQYEYVDYRDSLSSTGVNPDERYANAFAAALLMPEDVVRRFRAEDLTEAEMAGHFGVSREAMHHRLNTLNLA